MSPEKGQLYKAKFRTGVVESYSTLITDSSLLTPLFSENSTENSMGIVVYYPFKVKSIEEV